MVIKGKFASRMLHCNMPLTPWQPFCAQFAGKGMCVMRTSLLALCLTLAAAPVARSQDDSPLIGSEGTGVIRISMSESRADPQNRTGLSQGQYCTRQGCPRLQNAAMRAAGEGTQP
jgi:hypothetical protein